MIAVQISVRVKGVVERTALEGSALIIMRYVKLLSEISRMKRGLFILIAVIAGGNIVKGSKSVIVIVMHRH